MTPLSSFVFVVVVSTMAAWMTPFSNALLVVNPFLSPPKLQCRNKKNHGVLKIAFGSPLQDRNKYFMDEGGEGESKERPTRERDFNDVTAEIEAALQAAQIALDAADKNPSTLPAKTINFKERSAEIDAALLAAQTALDQNNNRAKFRGNDGTNDETDKEDGGEYLIDADKIFRNAQDMISMLASGEMNSANFQDYVQQKQEEARILQERIRMAEAKRRNDERIKNLLAVGTDGALLGFVVGGLAWAAFPDILGDHIPPIVPPLLAGGVLACAAIVGTTSDAPGSTILRSILGKTSIALAKFVEGASKTAADQTLDAVTTMPEKVVTAMQWTAEGTADAVTALAQKTAEVILTPQPNPPDTMPETPPMSDTVSTSNISETTKQPLSYSKPKLPSFSLPQISIPNILTTKDSSSSNIPNIPTLTNWKRNKDGSISGRVTGSPVYKDGIMITTSFIVTDTIAGTVVQTESGSRYYLDAETEITEGFGGLFGKRG